MSGEGAAAVLERFKTILLKTRRVGDVVVTGASLSPLAARLRLWKNFQEAPKRVKGG